MSDSSSFKDLSLKAQYDTDYDHIIHDFYNKLLPLSIAYDRAVGYFSTTSLLHACQGIQGLIKNGGKMRLIIGAPLTLEEFKALNTAKAKMVMTARCDSVLDRIILECQSKYSDANLKLFSYMIRTGVLEIKFALKRIGMYHEKIGVFTDLYGRKISFSGSANETGSALTFNANSESIFVFDQCNENIYTIYGEAIEAKFNALWGDNVTNVKVISPTQEFITRVAKLSEGVTAAFFTEKLFLSLTEKIDSEPYLHGPRIPNAINGKKYELRDHQINALKEWKNSNYRGILKMATGAGKTITCLHAAASIYTSLKRGIFFIIAVPYTSLAEQWRDEMERFKMQPILCYSGKNQWLFEFDMAVNAFNLSKNKEFYCAIVVNATFEGDAFQSILGKLDKKRVFFAADECHHHANEKYKRLSPKCSYMMGLSATPWESDGSFEAEELKIIYGDIVSEYLIDNALADGVLCPYKYKVINCEMTDAEGDEYLELSAAIGKLEAIKESGGFVNETALMHIYLKRSRLIGAIKSKENNLNLLMSKIGVLKKALFYCAEGGALSIDDEDDEGEAIINNISRILFRHGYKASRFTSEETASDRQKILEAFKDEQIDALVSKRVLDEGIDVPACEYAFILASTTKQRQYVQRRGRVLRHSPGKKYSIIYDFVTIPPRGKEYLDGFSGLTKRESARIEEFTRLSIDTEVVHV